MPSFDDSTSPFASPFVQIRRKGSGSTESSQYSDWVNDSVLYSPRIDHFPKVKHVRVHTPHPSPSFEAVQTAGVAQMQLGSTSVDFAYPEPVKRILLRQATESIGISDASPSNADNPEANNRSVFCSNRSSLTYGGDLTHDDEIDLGYFHFLPPRRFGFPLKIDEQSKATQVCSSANDDPVSVNGPEWPFEHHPRPEEIPLPCSPVLEGDDMGKPIEHGLQRQNMSAEHGEKGIEHHSIKAQIPGSEAFSLDRQTNSDAMSTGVIAERRQESPCSSLIDLYLGLSQRSSIASASLDSSKEAARVHEKASGSVRSAHLENSYLSDSPSQKLRSWISKKMSRLPDDSKGRATLDSSYHELPQHSLERISPLKPSYLISVDGYSSPSSNAFNKKQALKHRPIIISPEALLYERKKYASPKLDDECVRPELQGKAAIGEDAESQAPATAHSDFDKPHQLQEVSETSMAHEDRAQSCVAVGTADDLRRFSVPSGESMLLEESPSFMEFLRDYHRAQTWCSNRNMPASQPSTRMDSFDSNASFELDRKGGRETVINPRDHLLGNELSEFQPPSRTQLDEDVPESHQQRTPDRDGKTSNSVFPGEDSKMPGSYPSECSSKQSRGDISQPSINLVDSKAAQQTSRPATLPLTGKSSKPASIAEHKQSGRYSEPSVPPSSTQEAYGAERGTIQSAEGSEDRSIQQTPKVMRDTVRYNLHPDIQPRRSSAMFRPHSLSFSHRQIPRDNPSDAQSRGGLEIDDGAYIVEFSSDEAVHMQPHSFDGETSPPEDRNDYEPISTKGPWVTAAGVAEHTNGLSREETLAKSAWQDTAFRSDAEEKLELREFQKGRRRHHSFRGRIQASLHRANRKGVLARDWSQSRKRLTAIIACISTALIGLIVGIYAGQVPAIQYAIVDERTHYAVLGNVFFYLGLAITTILAWPLPLLFGRKRLIIAGMAVVLALQFPQALVCSQQRDPTASVYRVGLLLPRFFSGIFIGLANINLWPILLDVYGSSLQSQRPHQELVNHNDPRRHGGGMGIWLGLWVWCHIGSIGVGFVIGAVIIGFLNVAWGFWVVIFATLVVMLLNVIAPETRDPAFRKSMAEVRQGADVSRRVGRGEIMMHLYSTGPLHWWEEVKAGFILNFRMLKQSGFAIMAVYQGWIYGQVVMIMILLGALASRYYRLRPPSVGLCIAAFPIGALLAVPFQKASIFSRSRNEAPRTDSMTFEKRFMWSSHLVRRIIFMATLPLAATAYTLTSTGPPLPIVLAVLFAGLVGFLTNLALSECYGLIMETFDTSDLQPGMTGRLRKELPEDVIRQRTNFSCYPRVTAGFSIVQTISFIIAAVATAVGGNIERARGVQTATGFVAAVLVGLTLLLICALTRYRTVQVVPTNRVGTVELSGPGEDLPVIIGSPSGTTRRISLLELGNMTRWSEIRRKNKLYGSGRHGKYR